MTREEVISLLTQINKIIINSNSWLESTHEPVNTAFDMAIKALEQEPCEDCISRAEVLKLLEKEDWADTVYGVMALPSVTPQQEVEDV